MPLALRDFIQPSVQVGKVTVLSAEVGSKVGAVRGSAAAQEPWTRSVGRAAHFHAERGPCMMHHELVSQS